MALETLCLKKSKIKLLCNCVLCIVLFFYIVYSYYTREQHSKYNLKDSELLGKISAIKIEGDSLQLEVIAKEKVLVTYYFKTLEEKEKFASSLKFGDIYHFKGTFKKARKSSNKNLFSYHEYLLSKKIYWILEADSIKLVTRNSSFIYHIKNMIYKRVEKMKNSSYFYTFIVGDSSKLSPSIKEKWQRCGVSHLIAISGMHLGLFIVCLNKIFHKLPDKIRIFGLLSTLLLYVFIVGFSASVVRSFLLTTFTFLCKDKYSKIQQLLFIIILFLCYNPYYIYSVGFLFSFIITFFVLCMIPTIQNDNYIICLLRTSWISFLASIPIISISFFEVNLLSIISNLLMVPFVSFILFPLALLTFLCPVIEPIFGLFTGVSEVLIGFLDTYLRYMLIVPKMPFFLICIYYFSLFLMIQKNHYKCTLFIFVFIFLFSYVQILNLYTKIVVIDVGQGDAVLIKLSHGRGNVLIDTGGTLSYNEEEWKKRRKNSITESILIPYLKSEGIHKLDALFLTHGDFDHMGEAIHLVNDFKVENVILNVGDVNDLELELINILKKKNIKYWQNIKEFSIDKYTLYLLNTKEYDNENDNSSVIYFDDNNVKMLFMGDAGVDKEQDILKKYNISNIDILKVGHHGSNTSSSEQFIGSINPKTCLISVGKNNRYGHPKESVLDILKNCNVYRTDQDGSIEIKLNKNGYMIKTYNP